MAKAKIEKNDPQPNIGDLWNYHVLDDERNEADRLHDGEVNERQRPNKSLQQSLFMKSKVSGTWRRIVM